MAVAVAPCEERDGRWRTWWPSRWKHDRRQTVVLSVLSLLLATAPVGSRKKFAKSVPDLPNRWAGANV